MTSTTRSNKIEYIIENGKYIKNKAIQIEILNAAMRFVEDHCSDASNYVCESIGSPSGLNFFLDNYDDETIRQIYNIMFNYMKKLNTRRDVSQPNSELKPIPKMVFDFGEG
jgi:hypothetical protein